MSRRPKRAKNSASFHPFNHLHIFNQYHQPRIPNIDSHHGPHWCAWLSLALPTNGGLNCYLPYVFHIKFVVMVAWNRPLGQRRPRPRPGRRNTQPFPLILWGKPPKTSNDDIWLQDTFGRLEDTWQRLGKFSFSTLVFRNKLTCLVQHTSSGNPNFSRTMAGMTKWF